MPFSVREGNMLAHSLTRSLAHSPRHSPTHPLAHLLTSSLISSLPRSSIRFSWPPSVFQVSTSSWTVTSRRRTSGSVRPRWSSKWLRRPTRRKWRDSDTTRWVPFLLLLLYVSSLPSPPLGLHLVLIWPQPAPKTLSGTYFEMFFFHSNFINQWRRFSVQYPEMAKTMGEFTLEIRAGEFTDSEIMVMLGENGTVPSVCGNQSSSINRETLTDIVIYKVHWFVCAQARGRRPSSGCWPEDSNLTEEVRVEHPTLSSCSHVESLQTLSLNVCVSGDIPILNVSYKPQTISPKFKVGFIWWIRSH